MNRFLRIACVLLGLVAWVPAVRAQFRTFEIGGQDVLLERAEPTAGVFFRAFRPNQASGRWDVDVVVTNGTGRTLRTPLVLRFETATSVAPGIQGATLDDEGKAFFHLTPLVGTTGFLPGTALRAFTLSMGDARTRPELAVAVYSAPESFPLGVVRVLSADGLPAEGTEAEEIGPVTPRRVASGRGGWLSLEAGPGVRGWTFRAPGMEPMVRLAEGLGSGAVTELLTVRQVPVDAGGATRFPVQALPAPLPRGWSPAVVIRSEAGAREVELLEILPVGREAVWARWDAVQGAWQGVERVTGTGLRRVAVNLAEAGLHALLVPDGGGLGPVLPAVGGVLRGVNVIDAPAGLRAVGGVDPASASASREAARVTARARVEISSTAGALVSGLEVPCEVVEEYRLRDGSRRKLPAYTLRLVAFRPLNDPGTGPLVAEFPVRPFQLLPGEELSEARVRVDVLPPGAFAGGVLRPEASGVAVGSLRIAARAGDVAGAEAVWLREPSLGAVADLVPVGVTLVRAFELGVGAVAPGRRLGVEFGTVDPSSSYVLARAVFDAGQHGFQPVLRMVSDAAGKLGVTEPGAGGLPGVDGGGQYLLFKTSGPEALVEGVARNAGGQTERGMVVRRGAWTALTESDGRYRLLAPAGGSEVRVVDPVRGDTGTAAVDVGGTLAAVALDVRAGLTGPQVVSVSPTNNAVNVARVTPVGVTFSRALNPVTVITGGVQLVDPAGTVVPASVTLNLAGTTVTVLPVNALAPATAYRLKVASTVVDLAGRAVEGVREFGFTTVNDAVVRGLAAQVTIYAPGSTNLTPEILARIPAYDPVRDRDGVVVEGSQGTAEPRQKVVLVNESTGETQTVLTDTDGSFVSFVLGSVEDFISVVLVNANGTRNQIPATRQRFDDGTVGLFASGGTIRSTGPGVPVDLIVDPGSVSGKTLFQLVSMEPATFTALVGGNLPEGAMPPIGAFELTESGDPLREAADIRIPVKLSDLGLPPGPMPTNLSFVVVMPIRVDGRVAHQIVDTANYEADGPEGGHLRTASPPFVGMLARRLAQLAKDSGASLVTTPKVASNNDNPHKGETAAFGIMPILSRGPLKVGGFVRAVTRNEDGTETVTPVAGATVRVLRVQDERDGENVPVVFDGDLVSISDENGNLGFFFRPSDSTTTRALVATHPRFPFQRPRTGAFAGERQGTTVVTAELLFRELPPELGALEDNSPPRVAVSHTPDLPRAGTGAGTGADLFVVGVDDKEVGRPSIVVQRVENLRGEEIQVADVLRGGALVEDQPARKVRRYRLEMPVAGRVVLQASVVDATGKSDIAAHAVSFGVSRPPVVPTDPEDIASLRVIFSWPPNGATNLPALTPIRIRFNRSLPASLVATPPYDWLAFTGGHFLRRVEADSERREITVYYDGPTTGPVRLSVGPGITGESGKAFDQDPQEAGQQSFALGFVQARSVVELLEGNTGAGAALLGRFGYTLEREGTGGRLGVWDFGTPDEPERVRDIRTGYPTAMALIPGYTLPAAGAADGACVRENLLAVFTGHANEPKYLQLGRIQGSQITLGRRLVLSGGASDEDGRPSVDEGVTQAESLSQIVKAKWDPPYLGYFELGADVTSVKLINLHAFRRVEQRGGSLDGFGDATDGTDANGDGDFCDPGDVVPSPDRSPLTPPGMAFSFAPKVATERYDDFDFHAGSGLVVTVGRFLTGTNAPRFTTVLAASDPNPLTNAFVVFPKGDFLRRVFLLPATTVDDGTNLVSRDLALVSIGGGGDGALAVIDLTTPSAPVLVQRFDLPAGEGPAGSVQRRSDGLLAVASGRSTLLYDPVKLLLPLVGGVSRALVGRIDGTGTGVRDHVSDPSGIHLTFGGSNRRYVEAAPRFSFVRFNALLNPEQLAAQDPASATGFLRSATPVTVADVLQAGNGTNAPPMDPARHYYVMMDAPGGAADGSGQLPLVLSAVDATGMPQVERGGTPVPAVVGDEQLYSALLAQRTINLVLGTLSVKKALNSVTEAEGLVDRAKAVFKLAKSAKKLVPKLKSLGLALKLLPDKFVARRLSDDPNHPLYNQFLAGPFVVLGGSPTVEQLTALNEQAAAQELTRVYLRPSPRLWVGLPSERAESLLSFPDPFKPSPSRLPTFVSELRLNPTISLFGMKIPQSGKAIEEMARINQLPGNPASSFDLGEQVTLIVTLISEVPVVGKVLKGDWKPMLMPGAHGLLRVNHTERPMVLVPGFAASKLEINGVNHWLGFPQTAGELAASAGAIFGTNTVIPVLDRARKDLRIQQDGTPARETFPTDMLRFSLEVPTQAASIYGDWVNHLTGEMGFVEYKFQGSGLSAAGPQVRERLRLGGRPGLGQSPSPNLFVFPYDWRLDNQKAAEALKEYVRLALEMHPDADGIDLVGHSNGGLVSRAYLLMPGQRARVKRLITVGTPWLGSPKPLSGLKSGNLDDMAISALAPIPAVRKMLQFSPGAHQLLPSREYFELGFRPLVEDGYDANTNGLPNEAFDFDGFQEVIARHFLRGPAEELLNEPDATGAVPSPRRSIESLPGAEHPARRNANAFRETQAIGDHRLDPDDVQMHHIVGFGATPDTIGQLRIRGRLVPRVPETNVVVSVARVSAFESEQVTDAPPLLIRSSDGTLAVNPTNQFRMNEEVELRYVAGDGTVPIASLARGFGSAASLNATNARVHALVGGLGQGVTGHNPMLNTEEFLHIFDTVYSGREVEEIRVTASAGAFSEGSTGTVNVTGLMPGGVSGAISYVADFGDGTVELRKNAGGTASFEHHYRQSGTYLVTVGAAAKFGDGTVYGISSVRLTVANVAPEVAIEGGDLTVNRGETRVLVAKVTDVGLDDRHRFEWTLPAGNRSGPGVFATPVTFDEPGTNTVKVVVTDSDGGVGTASIRVTVRPDAPSLAASNFGEDPAVRRAARVANIPGFEGGHPEIMVRFHGHAPDELDTVGITVSQVGLGTDLAGLVFDRVFGRAGGAVLNLLAVIERALLPQVAQFLGKMAAEGGSDYARMMRHLPSEVAGIDLAATQALLGVRGQDEPIEVDLLYLEGGLPKVLLRWKVANVPAAEGLRLTFDWVEQKGTLERVTPDLVTGGPLKGAAIETVSTVFSAFGERQAGDRVGPAVVGILNPALDRVTVLTRDNLTSETNIVLFAVFDANENGRLDDDTFYPLDTNVVDFARLPERPFAVVGIDEHGNVGSLDPFWVAETRNFLGVREVGEDRTAYEQRLIAIRNAVRQVITEARDSEIIRGRFLLDPADLWVFEQGSGANLWKTNFVSRCNGIYIPGKSDNDYELFLPVHLADRFGQGEADRLRFEAAGPHSRAMLEGDWYFKRPVGFDAAGVETADENLVAEWEYRLPDGTPAFRVARERTDDDLASGFRSPLTPAEVIARVFTQTVRQDPALRALLPDTSFFPERREHFMFGRLHLQRPPEFGDDPIGDGGTGRQMLMLKWLLEGAYVTATDDGGAEGFSPGAPPLTDIFARWVQAGVPRAEGYEWGIFQDFAALKSKPFQVSKVRFSRTGADDRLRFVQRSVDDAVAQQQAARLKKLGKAAIRATLARLAGDTNLNGLITGIPVGRMTDASVRSFEHEILRLARSTAAAKEAFGEFAEDRDDITQPPDIGDFLKAKNGDREYLATLLHEPGAYQRFVETTFRFLRTVVQSGTVSPYRDYIGGLVGASQVDELTQRTENLNRVIRGREPGVPGVLALNSERSIARMDLPVSVEIYSPSNIVDVAVFATDSEEPTPAPGPGAGRRGARPAGDGPEPKSLGVASGALDGDELLDGTESGESLLSVEGEPLDVLVRRRIEGLVSAMGSAEMEVEGNLLPPPSVLPTTPEVLREILVFLNGPDRAFEILGEHEAVGDRPRSPASLIREFDDLQVDFLSVSGLGELTLEVFGTDPAHGVVRTLAEDDGNGIYTLKPGQVPIRVTHTQSVADEVWLRDEGPITFRVSGGSLGEPVVRTIMADVAELTAGGIEIFYTDPANSDRNVFAVGFLADGGFLSSGDGRFANDTATSESGLMRSFFLNGGGAPEDSGEGDFLHVSAHGSPSGGIFDHAGNLILLPSGPGGISGPDRWNADVEWVSLGSCNSLNDTGGSVAWQAVMRSEPHAVHAVLGFYRTVPADLRAPYRDFIERVNRGETVLDAYEQAMAANPGGPLPFAILYRPENEFETLLNPKQDPSPGGIVFHSFNDVLAPCGRAEPSVLTNGVGRTRDGLGVVTFGWDEVVTPSEAVPAVREMVELQPPTEGVDGARGEIERADGFTTMRWAGRANRRVRSTLDETAAEAHALGFLRTHWPEMSARLGKRRLGIQRAGYSDVSGAGDTWVQGFNFDFTLRDEGVPVWGDRWSARIVGDRLASVTWRLHVPKAGTAPVERLRPMAAVDALDAASAEIRQRLGIRDGYLVNSMELHYVPKEELDAGTIEGGTHLLAWRVVVSQSLDPSRGWYRGWLDPRTGRLLGLRSHVLTGNRE